MIEFLKEHFESDEQIWSRYKVVKMLGHGAWGVAILIQQKRRDDLGIPEQYFVIKRSLGREPDPLPIEIMWLQVSKRQTPSCS